MEQETEKQTQQMETIFSSKQILHKNIITLFHDVDYWSQCFSTFADLKYVNFQLSELAGESESWSPNVLNLPRLRKTDLS